jgi:hypothetical protein
MADEAGNREAFRIQQEYCEAMDAPITARVCAVLAECMTRASSTGARALDWPSEPTADALPLRLVGGLHALVRSGAAPKLSQVFTGSIADQAAIANILAEALARHDSELMPWLDQPPQTNEPARSGALMVGIVHIAKRFGHRMDVLEVGSSAGLNLLMDRYRFDLGGVAYGPESAPVTICPEWRGPTLPKIQVEFAGVRGCDVSPIDVTNPDAVERLAAYVWADNLERLERLTRAAAMITEKPVQLEKADAASWLETQLAEPEDQGVTRLLMHSVVWQYLTPQTQSRITSAMEAAGRLATTEKPLAWVYMEPDRVLKRQEVWVRTWPGNGSRMVAIAHAHGAWIEGLPTNNQSSAKTALPRTHQD